MLESGNMRSYLHLHFLVLIWGFTAIVGLLVTVSPVVLVLYRTAVSALVLGLILWFRKKGFKDIGWRKAGQLLLIGTLLSAHWMLFFASARIATASVCLAGLATTSLWTSLLEPLVYRKPVKALEVGLGVLAFSGLYLVFRFELDHALGLGLALLSALLAAMFTVANSKLVKSQSAMVITFYEMIGASLFSLVFALFATLLHWTENTALWPQSGDWIWILFLALVCTVYASTMATQLMKQFSAYLINLTINLEPVYGITLAFLIFGEKEKMTPGFYAGTGVIILAVALYPIINGMVMRKTHRRNRSLSS
ncbi:EamA-like transporter family protein [Dyadobacter jejuensis]|uniref:EamA-like transporter family protein n=1 Tax=Dyadobacter jejuensis TaxID=1082580 RepID=A0A316AHS7_9BACT|nr:DMT family transporter [Dyadobacter jejuensis]PWJ57191.1 EamA-like transporter family protein [Dyadobacter jejuensis]